MASIDSHQGFRGYSNRCNILRPNLIIIIPRRLSPRPILNRRACVRCTLNLAFARPQGLLFLPVKLTRTPGTSLIKPSQKRFGRGPRSSFRVRPSPCEGQMEMRDAQQRSVSGHLFHAEFLCLRDSVAFRFSACLGPGPVKPTGKARDFALGALVDRQRQRRRLPLSAALRT